MGNKLRHEAGKTLTLFTFLILFEIIQVLQAYPYQMPQELTIPKTRPAFHVDKKLKEASKKAAKAFEQEEKELKEYRYEKV